MAERNHLRIADQNDLPNDDPFAELTKIMGFDPRQPVRQQPAAEPSEAMAGEEDFGIDLEKELMGELEAEEAGPVAQAVFQPYQEAVDQADASEDLDEVSFEIAAFEDELATSLQDQAAQSPEADDTEEQIAAAFEDEFSLADDFMAEGGESVADASPVETEPVEAFDAATGEAFVADAEMAPAVDLPEAETEAFETAAEAEPFEASAEAHDFPFDEALEEELARADMQPVVQAEPADNGVFAAEDPESLEDENWEPEADDEIPVSESPIFAAEQPAAPDMVDDVLADDFDTALAEVDMDFSSMRAAVDERGPSAEAEAIAEADIGEPAEERDELSLEEELNALLGNTAERRPVVAQAPAVEAVAEIPAFEPVAEAPAIEPVQTAAVNADDLLDDLADDLDAVNWAFDAADPVEAQASHASEDDLPLDDAVSADLADFDDRDEQPDYGEQPAYPAAEETAEYEAEAADLDADLDLEFDDDAFDAAISDVIAGDEQPVLHAAEGGAAPAAWQEAEQPVAKEDDDPYAALAALTASMGRAQSTTSWRREEPQSAAEAPAEHEAVAAQDDGDYAPSAYEDFPDIETIDVPEHAVALADDLDIPELAVEENVPPAAVYDDLDAEFAGLLSDLNAPEKAAPAPAPAFHADDYAAEFERAFAGQEQSHPVSSHAGPAAFAAGLAGGAAFAGASHAAYGSAADSGQRDPDYVPGSEPVARDQFAVDDYDPDLDEEMSLPEYGAATREQPQRRGMLVAAIVGGVAVLGGLGAFAMSFGEGGSNEPAVVKADAEPVKIRPENPGGTTVPNQDKAVYDRVAGSGDAAQPRQEKLLTSAEEPIDVPAPEPRVVDAEAPTVAEAPAAGQSDAIADTVAAAADLPQPAPADALPQAVTSDLPGVTPPAKSEDRIAQVLQDSGVDDSVEVAAVAPRKVRTMIVKADGTLVPREDPKPVAEAPAATPESASPAPEATGAVPPTAGAPQAPAADAAASATPNSVPLAPARPSDQPVDIVGEVKPDQVAALAPASAANGAWSMQIASQPSEAAAQSSYQDLLRRYGGVLEGRQANIVKAEIAGKGTFWRVRVPAGSRSDAIKLCESYKSAGGNCFVSK